MPNKIKGYHPEWNPHKKTRVLLRQVDEIFVGYRAQLPLTLRQVFYILVANYGYKKTENAYENLGNTLGLARRAKWIPFDYLRDDSFSGHWYEHYADEDGFWGDVKARAQDFTLDKLAEQGVKIRVHCEAAGMLQQLERVCKPYSVPVYSCSGFDSLTVKHDLKEDIVNTETYEGKSTVILHLGDHDPSGESIFESMRDDVLAFIEHDWAGLPYADADDAARFERVLLTADQAAEWNLAPTPAKKSDSRSAAWGSRPTYQLEAVPPDVLAQVLRARIEGALDMEQVENDREHEAQARGQLLKALPAADGQ